MKKKNLAILIFDDVEVLDFAGPFEVFSVTDELNNHTLLNVYTVGLTTKPILAKNGLKVIPDFALNTCPQPNYLIIPGGVGIRALLNNEAVLSWLTQTAPDCENILSVCSGSLLLAITGMLNDLKATTHHQVLDELTTLAPKAEVIKNQRFVDNGKILTSAGVAAGIDMSLDMIGSLYGKDMSKKPAQ